MKKRRFFIGFVAFVALGATSLFGAELGASADSNANRPQKKLIELGWDIPTTEYIRNHWQEMEANAPFDGIMYDLVATSSQGKTQASQILFTADAWERDSFKKCVDDLNSCNFQRYFNNFIRINFYPTPFDWADDDAWKNVCEKAAICAWVARETKGDLCFDFESYGAEMFRHNPASGRTFAESKALARRRGAEFCRAIVQEYPDVVILCLWMNSINFSAGRASDPDAALNASSYGLLPSFIDGLLDACASETTFVDGCELGYYMNGAAQYDRAACEMLLSTGACASLVSPENRKKYRAQVQAGFGYYLDMYSNPEGSPFYRGPEPGETRFDRLVANLEAAWNAADEYVWIYGEQKRWWAPENAQSGDDWTSWEEALPGLTDFLFQLSDPEGATMAIKERFDANDATNLLESDESAWFERLGKWQDERSHGEFLTADGLPALKGVANACYILPINVKPYEKYFITGKIKTTGEINAHFTVRWQNKEGAWTAEPQDVRIFARQDAEKDTNGFREAFGVVVVPPDAYKLAILFSANGAAEDAVAVFDDPKAYQIKYKGAEER